MQRLSRELHQALAARLPVRAVTWGGSSALLPLFVPLAAARAATWLSCPRPGDVILAGDVLLAPLALALGRLFRRPVAAIAHGLDVIYGFPGYRPLVTGVLRQLDRVIAISESTRRLVLDAGVDSSRCVAIHPGVGQDARPAASRSGSRTLLTVTRLVPRKGVAWFVQDVLPLVPNVTYVVAGEGPERGAIEAAAAKLPRGTVNLLGRVDDARRSELLATADLFVQPSRHVERDVEGFGLAAAEAAIAGLPVIATALDSLPEVIRDGVNGRLIEPNEPQAFASAIVALLDDEPARTALSESARADAARFSWEVAGDRYAAAIAELAQH